MFVHDPVVRQAARELIAAGASDAEAARRLGVPRETVRGWRRAPSGSMREVCPRCWLPASPMRSTPTDYAELLGLYLGDGHIAQMARTQHLRLSLDARYPLVVEEAATLVARTVPSNRVGLVSRHDGRMTVVSAYHQHWGCLLPQHGPGKKHDRSMALEPWQAGLVERAPWALLRGLIRSDGCVYINRTGPYSYESYDFFNLSPEILALFVRTCEAVGVQCRVYEHHVRIYRRASVALMLEHVGRKR